MITIVVESLPDTSLIALATDCTASMSRPESGSSSMDMFGLRTAIWSTSERFFSPPENPSLRYLDRNSSLSPTWLRFLLRYF